MYSFAWSNLSFDCNGSAPNFTATEKFSNASIGWSRFISASARL